MRRKIIFIGGVGRADQFGGELTKNKYIIERLRECGYDVCVIDTLGSHRSIGRLMIVAIRFLYCLICRSKSVFVFSSSLGNIYPMLKLMHFIPIDYRIIYWAIGGVCSAKVLSGVYNRKYLAKMRKIVVEGEKMKTEFSACGLGNVMVMPNFKKIKEVPIEAKYDDGKIHFLFISRIMPQKGADYILQCAKRLDESGRSDRYVIDFYGTIDSEYAAVYKKQLESLPNVNYCGNIDLRDWDNYRVLARYHFMLFPTYWHGEGFPGVVIDAYIAGVPIIASDWNFNREFVSDGSTGLIIPAHDVDALYSAMVKVINGDCDIETMAIACRDMLPMYDVDKLLNQTLFETILR